MGLLINGRLVDVPGVQVISPASHGGPAWARLDPGDYRIRRTPWVRAAGLHTTKGKWQQHVKPGAGPGGRDKVVADFWRGDPNHSAAPLVVDNDGSVVCLADLATTTAYHATVSNEWCVGIEIYQEIDGGIYDAALDSTVKVLGVMCDVLAIPRHFVDEYDGGPCQRLLDGGPGVCGVYGHRHNTDRRGRGDPGDEIFERLRDAGWSPVRLSVGEDLDLGRRYQQALADRGFMRNDEVDGVLGPRSARAMRAAGFARWTDVA